MSSTGYHKEMKGPNCVFIGNIPYDSTDELLRNHLASVGTVLSINIKTDRDTGKPKGFGFCEYATADAAQAAIRNLNNAEYMGRSLRVDAAGDPESREPSLGGGPKGSDMIKKLVNSMSREEMVDILAETQKFSKLQPLAAAKLLEDNPPLAQTILHVLVLFNLVAKEDVAKFTLAQLEAEVRPERRLERGLERGERPEAPDRAFANEPRPHHGMMAFAPHPSQPNQDRGWGRGPERPPPDAWDRHYGERPLPPMPPAQAYSAPPPPRVPPPPPPAPTQKLSDEQTKLLLRVRDLKPEDIAKLAPNVQAQVRQIQASLMPARH